MQSNQISYGSFPYQYFQTVPLDTSMYLNPYTQYYPQFQQIFTPPIYLQNQGYQQICSPPQNYQNWNQEQAGVKLSSMTNMTLIKQEDNNQQQSELIAQHPSASENVEPNQAKLLQKVETVRHIKKSIGSIIQNRRGHWTNEEHYKYLKFVRQHKELFQTSVQKKLNRVFKMMSMEISSRTACQCRSHYSKFNPFDSNGKVRRKLVNDEQVYERLFQTTQQDD